MGEISLCEENTKGQTTQLCSGFIFLITHEPNLPCIANECNAS